MFHMIPDYASTRVLVVGDVMLDRYWHGGTRRISPEAPVPVVKVGKVEERPGGAGNVALGARTLGAQVTLLGVIGQDDAGAALKAKLSAAGIHHDLKIATDCPTICKLRVVSQNQQLIRCDFEAPLINFGEAELFSQFEKVLAQTDVVILSDYGKGTIAKPGLFIEKAKQAGKPIFIDPKGKDFERYKGATILTPNRHEFEIVMGECSDEEHLIQKGREAMARYDLHALLITRGPEGMTLLEKNLDPVHLPARAREVYDVTGAGDTVISVLSSSFATGLKFPDAAVLANLAASVAVGRMGAAAVTPPELRRAWQKVKGTGTGGMNLPQLLLARRDAKAHGERVVFTNGCFDILHAGHIQYLNEAKALGARLIVGVNDDASVKRLKGDARPVNSLERRMAVLAGLEAVDWVVPFSEDTPLKLIQTLQPDVLVKGGDYTIDTVVGADFVQAQGGEVKILSFAPGVSTTSVLEKIAEI